MIKHIFLILMVVFLIGNNSANGFSHETYRLFDLNRETELPLSEAVS
jgi:hypothetical protein